MKRLYLKTTKDKYELPLVVADSVQELAEKTGTTKDVIYSSISHGYKGWAKVILEGTDD